LRKGNGNSGYSLLELMVAGTVTGISVMMLGRALSSNYSSNLKMSAQIQGARELDAILDRIEIAIRQKNSYDGVMRPLSGRAWSGDLAVADNAKCPDTAELMPCRDLVVIQRKLTGAPTDYRKVSMTTSCVTDPSAIGTSTIKLPIISSMSDTDAQQLCTTGRELPTFTMQTIYNTNLSASGSNVSTITIPAAGSTTKGIAICFRSCPGLYNSPTLSPDPPSMYSAPDTIVIEGAAVILDASGQYDVVKKTKTLQLKTLAPQIVWLAPEEQVGTITTPTPTPTATATPTPTPTADPTEN
jgi:hypothetical protein